MLTAGLTNGQGCEEGAVDYVLIIGRTGRWGKTHPYAEHIESGVRLAGWASWASGSPCLGKYCTYLSTYLWYVGVF